MRRCVLLVEDTVDLREMWRVFLDYSGFQVLEADNGAEALALARAHHPDLVVMDLWMPVMDGIEAIIRLKQDPTTASVPILALTAQVGAESVARAAGCDEFHEKPIGPDELLRLIGALVSD